MSHHVLFQIHVSASNFSRYICSRKLLLDSDLLFLLVQERGGMAEARKESNLCLMQCFWLCSCWSMCSLTCIRTSQWGISGGCIAQIDWHEVTRWTNWQSPTWFISPLWKKNTTLLCSAEKLICSGCKLNSYWAKLKHVFNYAALCRSTLAWHPLQQLCLWLSFI